MILAAWRVILCHTVSLEPHMGSFKSIRLFQDSMGVAPNFSVSAV